MLRPFVSTAELGLLAWAAIETGGALRVCLIAFITLVVLGLAVAFHEEAAK